MFGKKPLMLEPQGIYFHQCIRKEWEMYAVSEIYKLQNIILNKKEGKLLGRWYHYDMTFHRNDVCVLKMNKGWTEDCPVLTPLTCLKVLRI